jgi:hypothetical protein
MCNYFLDLKEISKIFDLNIEEIKEILDFNENNFSELIEDELVILEENILKVTQK